MRSQPQRHFVKQMHMLQVCTNQHSWNEHNVICPSFFSFYNTSILNIEYRFPSNTGFSHEVLQHCEDNRCLDERRKCIKYCHVSNFFTAQPFIWGMISRPWRFRLRRTIAVSAGSRRFRLMRTIAAPNICRSWQIVKMLSTSALIIGPSIITVISWNS